MGLGELVAFLQYWIQMNPVLLHGEKPFIEVIPREVEWGEKLVSIGLYTLVRLSEWSSAILVTSVQFSRVLLFATPWTAACQASLSITNSWSPPKPMSIESVMPSNHLILYCPLLLPSIFLNIRVFSNESALRIRWPKYWSFSFNISPSSEHPELISFRGDWLDLLAVQGTLKSLLQHHSSKASIIRCSAFFMATHSSVLAWRIPGTGEPGGLPSLGSHRVGQDWSDLAAAFFIVQLSHPYMTTGKTIALTRWAFVDKVMSLFFNMLSRLVITFLPRNKRLLISQL